MSAAVKDISRQEISAAGQTLARAFRSDPLYAYIFGRQEHYDRVAPWMFSTWTRWSVLYGKAWATPGMEAVALRRMPGRFRVSLWSLLRTGMLATPRRLGAEAMGRFDVVIRLLEEKHAQIMGGAPHWYCWVLGVVPERQGQGMGGVLMRHTFAHADRDALPCYLETTSEHNVRIHGSQGYEVRDTLRVPGSDVTLYLMVRPPQPPPG